MLPTEFKTGVIHPVECFKEGWEIMKDQYWLFFGITLVGMLIGGVSMYICLGAMYCGIYYALLKKMHGQTAKFEDLFKGFSYFAPSLVAILPLVVMVFIYLIVIYGSMFAMMFTIIGAGGEPNPSSFIMLYGVLFGEMLVFGIILACIQALTMFAFPLIIDRGLSGMDALKTSAKAVRANLGSVIGLILVQLGLGILGYMACGIGLYFVFPVLFAGVAVAYRKVFPPLQNQGFNNPSNVPPPPSAFRDAGQAI